MSEQLRICRHCGVKVGWQTYPNTGGHEGYWKHYSGGGAPESCGRKLTGHDVLFREAPPKRKRGRPPKEAR